MRIIIQVHMNEPAAQCAAMWPIVSFALNKFAYNIGSKVDLKGTILIYP